MERWYLLINENFLFWTLKKSWWKDHIYLVFLSFSWYSGTWETWFFVQCKMFKHTEKIPWQNPTHCLIVLDHFLRSALKGSTYFVPICIDSITFCVLPQILHLLESVEIKGSIDTKEVMSFQGTAKCIKTVLEIDSLYVENFHEIWKMVVWYQLQVWFRTSRNLIYLPLFLY